MFPQTFLLLCIPVMVSSKIPETADNQKLQGGTNLTCLKSSDPGSVNASYLFICQKDRGHLWTKNTTTSTPLPQCSSSSFFPPPSGCEVCLFGDVYMICDNLTAGEDLCLEGYREHFNNKRTDCPVLPTPVSYSGTDRAEGSLDDENKRKHFAAVAAFLIFIFFVVVTSIILCIVHASHKNSSNGTNEPLGDLEMVAINQSGTGNGELKAFNDSDQN